LTVHVRCNLRAALPTLRALALEAVKSDAARHDPNASTTSAALAMTPASCVALGRDPRARASTEAALATLLAKAAAALVRDMVPLLGGSGGQNMAIAAASSGGPGADVACLVPRYGRAGGSIASAAWTPLLLRGAGRASGARIVRSVFEAAWGQEDANVVVSPVQPAALILLSSAIGAHAADLDPNSVLPSAFAGSKVGEGWVADADRTWPPHVVVVAGAASREVVVPLSADHPHYDASVLHVSLRLSPEAAQLLLAHGSSAIRRFTDAIQQPATAWL
jgi:hypothetical protein